MERILADMIERFHRQMAHYFIFAFPTGMRPEEIIALRWDDIDWTNRTIRVSRAKTFKGQFKDLKTSEVRDVDLVDRAISTLEAQKRFTYMKRAEIFENPVTGRPWHDERSQRDHYWKPCLKKLGIRARRAYQARHTYATTALMAGVNPAYIARQLGHANEKCYLRCMRSGLMPRIAGGRKQKWKPYCASIPLIFTYKQIRICPEFAPASPQTSRILVGTIGLEPTTPTMSR
ncbi:site-specific integrase [Collimonas silvisoli]|uniref:site-specific integrase n=1 Tax=Collimonas silvisoli TaxID=2825884 RepID=UPI0038B2D5CF